MTTATPTALDNFIKTVKHRACISRNFTEFEAWARSLNYKHFMKTADFNRLISVASVHGGLENTD